MLYLERSNRTERLLEGLASRLMEPGRDPLAPGFVVVQGPGMERWLSQSIASRFGICANIDFGFPSDLLERAFRILPNASGRSASRSGSGGRSPAWEPNRLAWAIARRLAEARRVSTARDAADLAPLVAHLDSADGDWRLVQLSTELATYIDRLITFRPDWIRSWSATGELPRDSTERWQACLVRDLTERLGPGHLADRASEFVERANQVSAVEPLRRIFPDRVEVFAVSTLPPLMLAVIDGLAKRIDVHLSVLSPSRGYWADLWREVREGDVVSATADAVDGERGLFDAAPATPAARLLAGLGRLGGDFQRCLEESLVSPVQQIESDSSPVRGRAQPTLLERLQADLLDLQPDLELGWASTSTGASDVAATVDAVDRSVRRDDDSIRVHRCSGTRRELEVVEAELRASFERDPSLTPEDVIVMAPRIDEIAPEIEAVFGVARSEGQGIPYRIADRGAFQRSPVAESFRSLLALVGGRIKRSELLEWLGHAPARARFGLDEESVERLAEWSERAGIRFGLDAAHRTALHLPDDSAHTWSGGLARLALAHAVGATGETFACKSAVALEPYSEAEILGAIGEIESMLCAARDRVARPARVDEWADRLIRLLAASCEEDDGNAHEHAMIRSVLQELASGAVAAGFDARVPFEAIRERVADALAASPAPQAFLAGGVTFCELVPLRAIPFRVIAILGLGDAAFPRGRPAPGFDLMARSPRAGDRNARIDDRYLFLEALVSARDRLILTMPGRDERDGQSRPPSVVVTELLDAIDDAYRPAADVDGSFGSVLDMLVVEHPLQAWSARYFETSGDPRLIARDAEAFACAEARRAAIEAGGGTPRVFLSDVERARAPMDGREEARRFGLDELIERITRATRVYARDTLGLRLPRIEDEQTDDEPVALDRLAYSELGNALLADLDGGGDAAEAIARLRAQPSIPGGAAADLSLRRLIEEVTAIREIAEAHRVGDRLPDVSFELAIEGDRVGPSGLVGRLDRLWSSGRVEIGLGRLGSPRELAAWVRHLVLCVLVDEGLACEPRSTFVGRPASGGKLARVAIFSRVDDPRTSLSRLVDWATSLEWAPLPLFPRAAREFASPALKGELARAWRSANQAYHGGESGDLRWAEVDEGLEHARVWEGVSPIDRQGVPGLPFAFDAIAMDLFTPFLTARRVDAR